MPPTNEENAALEQLHQRRYMALKNAFATMRSMARLSQEELRGSGFKSKQEAVYYVWEATQRRLDKMIDEHVRRFPDDTVGE